MSQKSDLLKQSNAGDYSAYQYSSLSISKADYEKNSRNFRTSENKNGLGETSKLNTDQEPFPESERWWAPISEETLKEPWGVVSTREIASTGKGNETVKHSEENSPDPMSPPPHPSAPQPIPEYTPICFERQVTVTNAPAHLTWKLRFGTEKKVVHFIVPRTKSLQYFIGRSPVQCDLPRRSEESKSEVNALNDGKWIFRVESTTTTERLKESIAGRVSYEVIYKHTCYVPSDAPLVELNFNAIKEPLMNGKC